MKYQWYKDGFLLVGETGPVLNFQPFHYRNEGHYCCRVENSAGDALSNIAVLQAGRSFLLMKNHDSQMTCEQSTERNNIEHFANFLKERPHNILLVGSLNFVLIGPMYTILTVNRKNLQE